MKKLSLKNLKLEVDELLQRNELKAILGGGYGNGGGTGGGTTYACHAFCSPTCIITCTSTASNCLAQSGPNGYCNVVEQQLLCSEECDF